MKRPESRSETYGGGSARDEVADFGRRDGANAEVGDFEKETVKRPESRSETYGGGSARDEVADFGRRDGANVEVGDFEKETVQKPRYEISNERRCEGRSRGRGLDRSRGRELRAKRRCECQSRRLRKKDGAMAGVEVSDLLQGLGRSRGGGLRAKRRCESLNRSRTYGKTTLGRYSLDCSLPDHKTAHVLTNLEAILTRNERLGRQAANAGFRLRQVGKKKRSTKLRPPATSPSERRASELRPKSSAEKPARVEETRKKKSRSAFGKLRPESCNEKPAKNVRKRLK